MHRRHPGAPEKVMYEGRSETMVGTVAHRELTTVEHLAVDPVIGVVGLGVTLATVFLEALLPTGPASPWLRRLVDICNASYYRL